MHTAKANCTAKEATLLCKTPLPCAKGVFAVCLCTATIFFPTFHAILQALYYIKPDFDMCNI